MKSCFSPTGLDHSKNRWTVNCSLSPGRTSVQRDSKCFFQSTKCPKCCTKVYLKGPDYITFWNLGNLGSWTLGSAILKEGYTLPFQFRPGLQGIFDTNMIGQRFPCIHHPAFFPRISWPKRVQTVWPQWLYQPWPPNSG